MARTEQVDRNATAARLNRIASLDGFSVKAAQNGAQQHAWQALFAIFKGDCVVFTASNPDRVRGWLYTQAV